jgi:hypothetical protein
MTYFYLKGSLTYLQKLVYTGTKDLFPNGIAADGDGLNGDDNSHYVPDSDRLAFGDGCMDDNEDTDVILHELGHAIHSHINPAWGGGDSSGIGEGFGDYWAISQRKQMKNGFMVDPLAGIGNSLRCGRWRWRPSPRPRYYCKPHVAVFEKHFKHHMIIP